MSPIYFNYTVVNNASFSDHLLLVHAIGIGGPSAESMAPSMSAPPQQYQNRPPPGMMGNMPPGTAFFLVCYRCSHWYMHRSFLFIYIVLLRTLFSAVSLCRANLYQRWINFIIIVKTARTNSTIVTCCYYSITAMSFSFHLRGQLT